jgi:hypothetical protein
MKRRIRELGSICKEINHLFTVGADKLAREADIELLKNLASGLQLLR